MQEAGAGATAAALTRVLHPRHSFMHHFHKVGQCYLFIIHDEVFVFCIALVPLKVLHVYPELVVAWEIKLFSLVKEMSFTSHTHP